MSCFNTCLASLCFLIFFFKISSCIRNNGVVSCPEIEKQSLLSFKRGLNDPRNVMSSWDGEVNCCEWKGVVCNVVNGHVHQLHLQNRDVIHEQGNTFIRGVGLSGKINSSLLNLKHLTYLDLSLNSFGETIPSFIGSFTNLEHLNLSNAGFHGKIPHSIGNLSCLRTLDLEDLFGLNVDSVEWLTGLSELEHLNMNYVNLSKATKLVEVINTLPSLHQLHLKMCSLDFMGTHPLYHNITSLTHLDLSYQVSIDDYCEPSSSSILRWVFQMPNLFFLDLRSNCFQGSIPTNSNATKLKYIDLSSNLFNSSIPNWFFFCKDLEYVDLSYNLLEGTISNVIANLTSLSTLSLEGNQLSGKIPKEIANLCKIERLSLYRNKLQGEIPDSFAKLSYLKELFLNDNSLSGNLPQSIGQLSDLEMLHIGGNMMSGVVTETHFANLTNLNDFSASGNHLSLKVSPNWILPIQLSSLKLGSWTLSGSSNQIPSWLHTRNNILALDLSNIGISGNVPSWFWEIPMLNISHNHLHGNILCIHKRHTGYGYPFGQLMYLSSNQFNGSLPYIGDTVEELDLSNNSFSGDISLLLCNTTYQTHELRLLHLGGNHLSGELSNCWTKWPSLLYLNVGDNNISGTIPNSIRSLRNLWSLNLYNNKFFGQIPSLHNCTSLVKINLADNNLHGNIPERMGTSLVRLRILILRSNGLNGTLSSNLCHLNSLQILDVSNNKFSGIIPRCLYNFTAMATKNNLLVSPYMPYGTTSSLFYSYSLYNGAFMDSVSVATKGSELQYDTVLTLVTIINLSKNNLSGDIPKELTSLVELRSLDLSENQLTGLIPYSIGDMKQLESLDLSSNFLSSQIPNSFTHMSFLSYVNLSYNNLTGRIPEGTQLQSLHASSFIGNNLCGPPLTRTCSHDGDEDEGENDDDDDEGDESEIEWFVVLLSLGYAMGLSGVCSALVLKKSWRDVYFIFLEDMWNKLYVYVHNKWTRLREEWLKYILVNRGCFD